MAALLCLARLAVAHSTPLWLEPTSVPKVRGRGRGRGRVGVGVGVGLWIGLTLALALTKTKAARACACLAAAGLLGALAFVSPNEDEAAWLGIP